MMCVLRSGAPNQPVLLLLLCWRQSCVPPLLSTTVPVVGYVMDDSADYKSQKQRGEENGAAFGMAGEKG